MKLGIYCAGGLGREVYELALDIQNQEDRWDEIFFISDVPVNSEKVRAKVIIFDQFCKTYSKAETEIAIAIGEPEYRKRLREKVTKLGYRLATLVHPMSRVSRFACLEQGVIVCYGCNISTDAHIKENTFFQPSSSSGHDTVVGNDCVISACARIAGNTVIGDCTYIGMSTLIREGITVGNYVIAAMGSIVQKSVEDEVIIMGNPARVFQKNTEHKVFK